MFVRLAEKLIDLYSDKSGAVDRDRVSLSSDFCPEKSRKIRDDLPTHLVIDSTV